MQISEIRGALARIGFADAIIQEYGSANEYIVRLPLTGATVEASEDIKRRVQTALAADPSLGAFEIRRVEFVGPRWAETSSDRRSTRCCWA